MAHSKQAVMLTNHLTCSLCHCPRPSCLLVETSARLDLAFPASVHMMCPAWPSSIWGSFCLPSVFPWSNPFNPNWSPLLPACLALSYWPRLNKFPLVSGWAELDILLSFSATKSGLPGGSVVKNAPANAGESGLWGRSPGDENGNHPVFLPGESQGERSLAGYSPWGRKQSETT